MTPKKLTKEAVDKAAARLRNLPAPQDQGRDLTKLEAIRQLAKDIRKLQERGYKLDDIAEELRSLGIDVNANTLSTYLGRIAGSRAPKKKKEAAVPPPPPSKVEAKTTKVTPAPPRASPAGKGSFSVRPDTPDI